MEIIKKTIIDNNFWLEDIYVFTKNNYSFLLGKNGTSMIVSNDILDNIKKKELDENLKIKLLNHGLAELKDIGISISKKASDNVYFIIDITKKCNFDCIYCFRNLEDKRVISDDVLKDICKYILNIVKEREMKNVTIQVWGGEPLLAMDKIEYIYNFFHDININLHIDIETNGSLITKEIAKKLYNMNVSVGISIDGEEKHQNIQRKLVNGESTSDLVINGINNLREYYGDNIGGITVITKYNYQDIDKIIDYFVNKLNIHSMKFNIVRDNPNALEENIGLSKDEIKTFANNLYDTVKTYNRLEEIFHEDNIKVRYDNLIERANSNFCSSFGCSGGENIISFDNKGNIYPCEMMDYPDVKIGSIYHDDKISDNSSLIEQIAKAKNNNIYFKKKVHEKCNDCPWYYYCRGGCTSRIIYSKGKMEYDEVECEFNKVIYERLVNDILDDIEGNS